METCSSLSAATGAALRMVLRGLLTAIGGFGLEAELAVLLHRRIVRAGRQIERMLVRFRAGRLWTVGQRKARIGATRRRRIDTLPRRFGWLVIVGRHRAAGFGSQLQAVLAQPDMAELLAASPQARRLLRPLCRALAVELPGTVPAVRKPIVRKRRAKPAPEPFRIPLPRGVLAAARRQGFGKLC
jgi:hypothetical protein